MCKNLEIISKNNYGVIYHCTKCNVYQVLFNNIHFILNKKQISALRKHISSLDIEYWESIFINTSIQRKIPIPIPTSQENLMLIFNKQEFYAFKNLLFVKDKTTKFLSVNDFDYNFIIN
jgi:hypothetical protein